MNFEKTFGKVSIEKDNVLLFYDIPIFFYEKKDKEYKLFYLHDENFIDNQYETEWIVSSVNKVTIENLILDKISIYDALIKDSLSIKFVKNSKVSQLKPSDCKALNYLPKKDILLNNISLKEKLIYQKKIQEKKSNYNQLIKQISYDVPTIITLNEKYKSSSDLEYLLAPFISNEKIASLLNSTFERVVSSVSKKISYDSTDKAQVTSQKNEYVKSC